MDQKAREVNSDPYGTRTRVAAVKGPCPRPLDEGASTLSKAIFREGRKLIVPWPPDVNGRRQFQR